MGMGYIELACPDATPLQDPSATGVGPVEELPFPRVSSGTLMLR